MRSTPLGKGCLHIRVPPSPSPHCHTARPLCPHLLLHRGEAVTYREGTRPAQLRALLFGTDKPETPAPPSRGSWRCHWPTAFSHPQFSTLISSVLRGLGDPHTPSGSGLARSWPVSSGAAVVSTWAQDEAGKNVCPMAPGTAPHEGHSTHSSSSIS